MNTKILAAAAVVATGWAADLAAAPEPFALVVDGRLVACVECGGSAAEALATNEYYRIVRAVTGCEVNSNALAAAENRLVIRVKGDRNDNDTVHLFRENAATFVLEGNCERAAAGAVYRLLEELGCRWYWAGDDSEYLPDATKTLSVRGDFEARERCAFRYRQLSTHPVPCKYRFLAHNRSDLLTYRARGFWDWGHSLQWGGHSFGAFVPPGKGYRNYEDHFRDEPECFALWKGKRVKDQHCYTSPRTRQIFTDFMDRFWTSHAGEDLIMNLSALDTPVCCECENCRRTGDPSTLYFSFLNYLIGETEKKHPGKTYDTYAYSFYRPVPKCSLDPHLMMTYCQYNRCYRHLLGDTNCTVNAGSLREVAKWHEKLGRMPDIYGYHYDAFDWHKPLMLPIWDVLQDEIRWCRDGKIRFYKTEFYGGKPKKEQRFSSYALLKLFWNPDLDLDALMTEYTDRVFGKAGPEIKAYWKLLAKAWSASGCLAGYGNKPGAFAAAMLTPAVREEAERLFAAGRAKLAEGTRERKEFDEEYGFWNDWRDITRSRDDWTAIAEKPDAKRLAALKAAAPGRILYPQPGLKDRPTDIDWFPLATNKEGQAVFTMKSDGLLFGNHPGVFADHFWLPCNWVNYQLDFEFRYPKHEVRDGYRMKAMLRLNGERFAEKFGHLYVLVDRSGAYEIGVYVAFHHDGPKRGPEVNVLKRGKLDRPLDDGWHRFSARVVDTALVAKVDDAVLFDDEKPIPVGRGMINVQTGTHPPCPLQIRYLSVHHVSAPGDPFEADAPKPKGRARVDGSGRTIYE